MTKIPENAAPTTLDNTAEQIWQEGAAQAYGLKLDLLAINIPEVGIKREAIEQAGAEIIEQFEIQPTLFEDEGRSIIFTAIADRWASNMAGDKTKDRDAERTFLADSVALLAYEHSPKLATLKQDIEAESDGSLSPEQKLRVYDKYTDKTLSAAMKQKFDEGLVDDVKKQLGINTDNEEPFEIRVLTIDKNGFDGIHINAPLIPWDDIPGDYIEKKRVNDDRLDLFRTVEAHKKDLVERAVAMGKELGLEDAIGKAWITKLGEEGRTTLCISMPLAEKIISPELTKHSSFYNSRNRASDLASIWHEYTHTQGGVNIDQNIFFGINLEELRAEHFSGNKQGYQDIKGFFSDLNIVTGFSAVSSIFADKEKGGTASDAYTAIASSIGLKSMLEIAMAAPRIYLDEQSNPYQRSAVEYLGDFDGIMSRLLEAEKQKGNGEQIENRIAITAERILDNERKTGMGKWFLNYRKKHGLNVITDLIAQKVEALEAAS